MKTVPLEKMKGGDWGEAEAKADGMELEVASAVEAAAKEVAGEADLEK